VACLGLALCLSIARPTLAQSEYTDEGLLSCLQLTDDLFDLDLRQIETTGQTPKDAPQQSIETYRLVQGFIAGYLSAYQIYRQENAQRPVSNARNGVRIIVSACEMYPEQRLMDVMITHYRDIIAATGRPK